MAKNHHEPIYRPILRDAFSIAWEVKPLWIIAAFAGILLSGSLWDVIWRNWNAIGTQTNLASALAPFWLKAIDTWSGFSAFEIIIGSLNVLLISSAFLIVGFAIFSASVIAQGTTVYAIGARRRGKQPTLRDAITVGARALWPIFVLNIFSLAILMATRGLIAIAFAALIDSPSSGSYLLYLAAFIVFALIAAITVIIQIFALNAMILQGATLTQGIERGFEIFRKHWVIVLETAILLFVISIGLFILTIVAGLIASVPYIILLFLAALTKSGTIFAILTGLFFILFVAVTLIVFGFNVTIHYATWTLTFRKLGEGGVVPKLHRLARLFVHGTHVPGS